MPRLSTMERKHCCGDVSIECLAVFHRNKAEIVAKTMDETWVHHFTPETIKLSKQWTEMGESVPKKAHTVPSAGKVLASISCDARGILFIDLKRNTINSEYYANLLRHLTDEINKKRILEKKVLCHQDHTPG